VSLDAFFDVARKVVVDNCCRSSSLQFSSYVGNVPPSGFRRFDDGDRPVILFNDHFQPLLNLSEHAMQVLRKLGLGNSHHTHTPDHTFNSSTFLAYTFILSNFRYNVFRSIPKICAALLLLPPVADSTRRI
jgi:hypothetical protein